LGKGIRRWHRIDCSGCYTQPIPHA
jgi:hypothetical protein